MEASEGWQAPAPEQAAGHWEYEVFSDRMYGRIKCKANGWPPRNELPREMAQRIDLSAKRLLARVGRMGWTAAEPTDALSLWKAGRVAHTLNGMVVGVAVDRADVTFRGIRVRCRRWVPDAVAEQPRP